MPLTLTWRDATRLHVDGSSIRPDRLSTVSSADVARQALRVGNAPVLLGELFHVSGNGQDARLILEGDLSRVTGIGRGMESGSIESRGDVGSLLGAEMLGGSITVEGSAGEWAGAEMRGGLLRISGSAGDGLAAALPGSRLGMRDGTVLVGGRVGLDAGLRMRRGLIALGSGASGDLGRAMVAGSIFAFGDPGLRPGAGMKRGTIALLGPGAESARLLPTFVASGFHRPPFLAIYLKWLVELGFPVPDAAFKAVPGRYNGDLAEGGQGEIFVGG